MTVVWGAVLAALQVIGVVLAVFAVLVVVILFLPVGLDIRWTKQEGAVWQARFGPLKLPLYPFPEQTLQPDPARNRKETGAKAGERAASESTAPPAPSEQAVRNVQSVPPQLNARQRNETPKSAPAMPSADEMDGLFAAGRILARVMWPHRNWLLRRTRVQHLRVYWTVTGEDAADTAVTYGRRIAALNTLLAVARDWVEIHADSLRLEPDFTGEQKEKRSLSCQLRARAYIMIGIFRILLRRSPISGQTPLREILSAFNA